MLWRCQLITDKVDTEYIIRKYKYVYIYIYQLLIPSFPRFYQINKLDTWEKFQHFVQLPGSELH